MATDAHVSPRALREIYLKGFEIAVKESAPYSHPARHVPLHPIPFPTGPVSYTHLDVYKRQRTGLSN